MVCVTRAQVDAAKQIARQGAADRGLLRGPEIEIGGRPWSAGDRITTRTNNRNLGVTNGQRWEITDVNSDGPELRVRPLVGDRPARTLPSWYVAQDGAIEHAYATTVFRAQGATTGHCHILASEHLAAELGYVAATRGRTENHFYALATDIPDLPGCLARAGNDTAASTHTSDEWTLQELSAQLAALERWHHTTLGPDPGPDLVEAQAQLRYLHRRRGHLAAPSIESGVSVAIEGTAARVDQLRIRQAERGATARAIEGPWTIGSQRLNAAITHRRQQLAERLQDDPPPHHIVNALGARPDQAEFQTAWQQAARAIEEHRDRWGIPADDPRPFGSAPMSRAEEASHQRGADAVEGYVARHQAEPSAQRSWTASRHRDHDLDLGIDL